MRALAINKELMLSNTNNVNFFSNFLLFDIKLFYLIDIIKNRTYI